MKTSLRLDYHCGGGWDWYLKPINLMRAIIQRYFHLKHIARNSVDKSLPTNIRISEAIGLVLKWPCIDWEVSPTGCPTTQQKQNKSSQNKNVIKHASRWFPVFMIKMQSCNVFHNLTSPSQYLCVKYCVLQCPMIAESREVREDDCLWPAWQWATQIVDFIPSIFHIEDNARRLIYSHQFMMINLVYCSYWTWIYQDRYWTYIVVQDLDK